MSRRPLIDRGAWRPWAGLEGKLEGARSGSLTLLFCTPLEAILDFVFRWAVCVCACARARWRECESVRRAEGSCSTDHPDGVLHYPGVGYHNLPDHPEGGRPGKRVD